MNRISKAKPLARLAGNPIISGLGKAGTRLALPLNILAGGLGIINAFGDYSDEKKQIKLDRSRGVEGLKDREKENAARLKVNTMLKAAVVGLAIAGLGLSGPIGWALLLGGLAAGSLDYDGIKKFAGRRGKRDQRRDNRRIPIAFGSTMPGWTAMRLGGPVSGPLHAAGGVPVELEGGENVWSRRDVAIAGGQARVEQLKRLAGALGATPAAFGEGDPVGPWTSIMPGFTFRPDQLARPAATALDFAGGGGDTNHNASVTVNVAADMPAPRRKVIEEAARTVFRDELQRSIDHVYQNNPRREKA